MKITRGDHLYRVHAGLQEAERAGISKEQSPVAAAEATRAREQRVHLYLPRAWEANNPLTIADLDYEKQSLQTIGLQLDIEFTDHDIH